MQAIKADLILADPAETRTGVAPAPAEAYEAPSVERVMTPDDLAREVHYAGTGSIPG
jgi:hypothetical protein